MNTMTKNPLKTPRAATPPTGGANRPAIPTNRPALPVKRLASAAAAILAFAAGCTSLQRDNARYYVLETPPPEARLATPNGARTDGTGGTTGTAVNGTTARTNFVLAVDDVRIPPYLDRTEIVLRNKRDRLDLCEGDLWLEPLGKGITRVLADDLAARLAPAKLSVGQERAGTGAIFIQTRVLALDLAPGKEARLRVRWRLCSFTTGTGTGIGEETTIASGEDVFAAPAKTTDDLTGCARALGAAVDAYAARLAGEILASRASK
ncbi:MAG: PqiC family protein [Puniceicoccales bacterium]|jgi:uncharacterized lipoprotein YmbA|nr:PqiC family protein [Puniceicoccales bacterium]